MKKIIPTEPPKLIFSCFFIVLFYILVYEFLLVRWPSSSETAYKIGVITSRISYSILAACIFYFISIYIPIYLPKQKRKRNILFNAYQKILIIQSHTSGLKLYLGIFNDEFEDSKLFREKLKSIDIDKPVGRYRNWHLYLSHLKTNLIDVIRSITFYDEYLSVEFFHELILLETELLSPYTFESDRTLMVDTLEFGEINLQQLLFHTKHLLELREKEFVKYEKDFNKDGAEYRKTYYEPLNFNPKQ